MGYGVEGTVTDLVADGIINNKMKPYFKEDQFDEGLNEAVVTISSLLKGNMPESAMQELKYGSASPKGHLTKEGKIFIVVMLIAFIYGVGAGFKKLPFKIIVCILLGSTLLGALYGQRLALLLGLTLFVPWPAFAGFALVRFKMIRIAALMLIALILAFIFIGKRFGPEVQAIALFGSVGLLFLGLVIFRDNPGC